MKKAIIDYSRQTPEKVIALANAVSNMMYGNALFPAPPVAKAAFDTQVTTVTDAKSGAVTGDRMALAKLRKEKAKLLTMLRQDAEYVNTVVIDGDDEKLLSSGFEISKTPEKNQLPSAITKIDAVFTNAEGKIDLSWKRSKHASYYQVYMSGDNGQTWTLLNSVFGRKMLVEQLVSGKRYQFKVLPVGLHGNGPVSDVASQLAA